ncbi:choice-of-anchor tandem repeat GloVer-containing protein [Occallatibacter riparius]|uniref:IPT/TIG domain-containing protein n=1 Tax=Occallatibacter riparius TaxID=1002689 RepID=A0A9J7BS77_9BACT|nr:choice-of-anchor tandem repeat GloVer-containing protein [Occallatibacter riparius]UWZ83766.1 hypothetical protein MOP44_24780 [Occallatibacter riparius]
MEKIKVRILLIALAVLACPALEQAQINLIYTFNSPYDACCPVWSNLIAQGRDGNLYSTMPQGVGNVVGNGSWFVFPPNGIPLIRGFLTGGPVTPNSGLTLGIDGNFYGSTEHGGLGNGAYGTLFKLRGTSLIPVYFFTGTGSGTYPASAPIQGPDGYLYGTTYDGSTAGVVYKVDPSAGTLVWSHALPSGTKAPLIIADDGNFYGTFPHGGLPINGVAPSNDNGGGIFRVTPGGVLTGIYNINPLNPNSNGGHGDGGQPWGPVMQASDGALYGTASDAGQYNGGTVYRVQLDGSGFTILHNFQTADGVDSESGLVEGDSGYLFGLCSGGGTAQGVQVAAGTIFRMDVGGINFLTIFNFYRASGSNGVGPGSAPLSTPMLHTNGRIYGLTSHGGTSLWGSITYGAYDDGGELFSIPSGSGPIISVVGRRSANVNDRIGIIGQGLSTVTGVTFGGIAASPATVKSLSDTYMEVVVPPGARTGILRVYTPTAAYHTLYRFKIACSGQCAGPQ